MYRSIYFKIILIFVMLMVTVMAVVGLVLLNSVTNYYTDQFTEQLDGYFRGEMRDELSGALASEEWASEQKSILRAYSTYLGIDVYRNYYILDSDGEYLDGSNEELGRNLIRTPNLLRAMLGEDSSEHHAGDSYCDYAVYLSGDDRSCIIYVKDTQEEMTALIWELFTIILETVLFGIVISVLLSFFLARAISNPVRRLTDGVQLVMDGHFSHIEVTSNDEIGTLTDAFNDMSMILKSTLDEISGERMKLETIFSCIRDAVVAFRDDGSVLNINQSALKLFEDDFSSDFSLDRMLSVLNAGYAASLIRSVSQTSGFSLSDIEYGSSVFDLSIGYLRYSEKNTARRGYVIVLHDVTERYELAKSQRDFVANVSHELGTPLSIIRGSAESIQLDPDMPEEMRTDFINMAVDECERMKHIIEDLLTLSRLDSNRTRWNVTDFDLSKSLTKVCDAMRTVASQHSQTVNVDCGENIMIRGDRERLEQVMINIISNSIKYSPDGGRIDVRLTEAGDETYLYVRDNGIGISQEDLPRLFDRFYRVDKARTSGKGGTGLGLAITKEIVEAHGGSISAKSREGVGTLMSVVLPKKCSIGDSPEAEEGSKTGESSGTMGGSCD